jgi:hypothetical protein
VSSNDYHFITHWRVQGTVQEVAELLADAEDLVRWWPSVYLDVQETTPGDEDGIGKEVSLYTRGWLPYTLRWQFRVTESDYPQGFAIEAWGDLDGRGEWTLQQDGDWVNVTYDWKIQAEKPLLRQLSFLMKPIFAANHRWAMARGEESLRVELARRKMLPEEQPFLQTPPGAPAWNSLLIPTVLFFLTAVVLVQLLRRYRR